MGDNVFAWRRTGVAIAYCGQCGGERGFRLPDPRTQLARVLDKLSVGVWSRLNRRRLDRRKIHAECTSCGSKSDEPVSRAMFDAASGIVADGRGIRVVLVLGPISPRGRCYRWACVNGRDELVELDVPAIG